MPIYTGSIPKIWHPSNEIPNVTIVTKGILKGRCLIARSYYIYCNLYHLSDKLGHLAYSKSFLDVLVGLDCKNTVHDLMAVQVLDRTLSRLRLIVLDNRSSQGSAEVVLLDMAFFHGALSCEELLTHIITTYRSSFVNSGLRPKTLTVRNIFSLGSPVSSFLSKLRLGLFFPFYLLSLPPLLSLRLSVLSLPRFCIGLRLFCWLPLGCLSSWFLLGRLPNFLDLSF